MRTSIVRLVLAALTVVALIAAAPAMARHDFSRGCNTRTCEKRVCKAACHARLAAKLRARAASAYPPISAADRAWLNKVGNCESNGYADKRNPKYRGRYQFGWPDWARAGGHGDPADASPAEQDYRALKWRAMNGVDSWPVCG